ncbi:aminoacyltransferase [Streptococcus didelphis]|uniref:aminoacyltransferase n=1 Tax=Streptococcus didelphis TaxID=102886 RepID=UPI00037266B6|nr:aminoacyltransferase [Streptococcus didelphis]WMB29102.1 aminoacyltransferase [Streptococcus didelphis]
MYSYKSGISAEEHDTFLLKHQQCNLLQSSKWASIKQNWDKDIIGFYEDGRLVASASILIKKLPLKMTMIYIPRGPIMDYSDYNLVDYIIHSLKKYGRQKNAIFIKCDPLLPVKHYQAGAVQEDISEDNITPSAIQFLRKRGLVWSGLTTKLDQTIQPRLQANIYADKFDYQSLSKKTKQAIRTAQNKGIDIVIGSEDLLEDFASLMKKTEDRKHINLRGIDYYRKLLQTYKDNSYITMAILDLPKRKQALKEQLLKEESIKAKFTSDSRESKIKANQEAIMRIQEELNFIEEEMTSGKEILPLAATLSLIFGNTSENLYAGMDDTYRHYQAALVTWYETANEAFKRGCRWQNMGGIENQLDGGLYYFKSRLNPTIEEFAGEFNIPVNPLYKPAMLAYNLRKKLRSK